LLADSDVSLSDEDSSVVHGVGELSLGDEGLKSSLHELVDGETEDVIELSLVLLEEAELDNSPDESVTFESSSGVGGFEFICKLLGPTLSGGSKLSVMFVITRRYSSVRG